MVYGPDAHENTEATEPPRLEESSGTVELWCVGCAVVRAFRVRSLVEAFPTGEGSRAVSRVRSTQRERFASPSGPTGRHVLGSAMFRRFARRT